MGTCPTCRSGLIEVPMTVGEEPVVIVRCSQCDTHHWERGGVVIDVDEVIDLTSEWTQRQRAKR